MMDDTEREANPASGMLVTGILCILGGITVISVGGALVFPHMDALATLSTLWTEGGSSLNALSVTMLYVAIGMGAVVLVFGLVGVASYLRKNRLMASIALAAVFICTAVQLAGGALFFTLIDRSFNILEPSAVDEGVTYSQDEAALLETSHAVFNLCCEAVWSVSTDPLITNSDVVPGQPPRDLRVDFQAELLDCADEPTPLPAIVDIIPSDKVKGVLQTCFDPPVYNPIANYINNNAGTCEALEKVNADFGADLVIPTTNVNLNNFLVSPGLLIPEGYVIGDWSMTGFPAFRDANGEEGFNCGLMYAKGVAFIQNLFLEQTGQATCIAIFVAGALQMLAVLFTAALWFMGGNETQEEWMDYDKKTGQISP